uniref:Calcineurin-like phosphoesterase domain-containing protein n=1 Tax=Mycena chlorophos TaxID=658473 RepID=A0ABQ0L6D1_MYCCL|nr:predicted protein [Mycena chlorophos]
MAQSRARRITSPTSIVQLDYEYGIPEAKPESGSWTRFVLISDTHASTFSVPDGDILLHSGDLTRRGTLLELKRTMEWLYALPHPVKIVIAGNRDFSLDRVWYDEHWQETGKQDKPAVYEPPDPLFDLLEGPRAKEANVVYLQNARHSFTAGGREWTVYGSALSPNFGARIRAFGYDAEDADAMVAAFPEADILMTHGPPRGILDRTTHNALAGCPALTTRVSSLRPRLHLFGHIHESHGAYVHEWTPGNRPTAQTARNRTVPDFKLVDANPQTVFINAANTPKVAGNARTPRIGSEGFKPVVLDLLN